MEKLEILTTILFVATLGSINALFSYFMDFCFYENSIFGKWLPFLAKINLKIFDPNKLQSLDSAKSNPQYGNMLIDQAQQYFFFKILGGCAICSNIWVGFFSFGLIFNFFDIHILFAIPYLLWSSFILRKIMKQ
jgi:hypothetical protein